MFGTVLYRALTTLGKSSEPHVRVKVMSETHPSDSYRICKFSFRVKFGNVSGKQFYSSSQNLFKPSQRKDSFGIVLADVCKQVGLVLLEDPQEYSDRVCNSCARKIQTLGNLFEIVKTATLPTISGNKRSLATPEKVSPSWRKEKRSKCGLFHLKSKRISDETTQEIAQVAGICWRKWFNVNAG